MPALIEQSLILLRKYRMMVMYLIFGFFTAVISVFTFWVALQFGINVFVANIISWVIAVLFAFVTNKLYVFESKSKENWHVEMGKFFGARLVTLGIEMGLLYIGVDLLHADDMLSKIVATFVAILANYVFSKYFVFKRK
ncbi:MAG: GtrA family protein [Bifidobacteriaceae bacterium]|nr:GtrA family protein [Bifidobacteriaceae bacterium]